VHPFFGSIAAISASLASLPQMPTTGGVPSPSLCSSVPTTNLGLCLDDFLKIDFCSNANLMICSTDLGLFVFCLFCCVQVRAGAGVMRAAGSGRVVGLVPPADGAGMRIFWRVEKTSTFLLFLCGVLVS